MFIILVPEDLLDESKHSIRDQDAAVEFMSTAMGGIVLYSSRRSRRGGSHYQAPAKS